VAARPDDARAWSRLGRVQSPPRRHEASLRSFGRPSSSRGWPKPRGHGRRARELARYDEAAAAYERAVKLDAYRPGPFVGLAVLHAREQRYPQALDAYEQARPRPTQVDQCGRAVRALSRDRQGEPGDGLPARRLARDPDNTRGRTLIEQVQKTARKPEARL
jgi:tetratricopeptide (TPR) repeat protein